ncbi:hypothetical protein ACN27G_25920 [Plantactinospora sp. WMMB334]|uniref:hypothetical protein n=1 Tax=Plantactinospora sp. WMMB334 TaxID=3404119 RepID=UPI003B92620A
MIEVSASTMDRRVLAAALGHFILMYERLCAYQVVAFLDLVSRMGRPVSVSNGSPALDALTNSDRKESASA